MLVRSVLKKKKSSDDIAGTAYNSCPSNVLFMSLAPYRLTERHILRLRRSGMSEAAMHRFRCLGVKPEKFVLTSSLIVSSLSIVQEEFTEMQLIIVDSCTGSSNFI